MMPLWRCCKTLHPLGLSRQGPLFKSLCVVQSGSVCSPGGSNHPIDLEHWVTRSRPKHLSVLGTQVQPSRSSMLQFR